jgi:benzoyl-CoA-dihydrodiol lyase
MTQEPVDFQTHPDRYRHWSLRADGDVASLTLDVSEESTIRPGYRLKSNSYDLGVDIELSDALQRIRFEHPNVKVVVLKSAQPKMFCSGANIYMLGASSHAWKVNFCKFTNETRCGMEDSSDHGGPKFIAALSGATAGGGYELALACDEILMVDDRSTAVMLPEVPLLGVLPGTGGLTRLVDKRGVRRDLADVFCTRAEGVRADKALAWRLVDRIAPARGWEELVSSRTRALAEGSARPSAQKGVALPPLEREIGPDALRYSTVEALLDRARRTVDLKIRGPLQDTPTEIDAIVAQGAKWWPLRMARELDDLILNLRTNHADLGTWVIRTEGDAARVLRCDETLVRHAEHWFVRETIGMLRRTLRRLDMSSRSMFAVIERGSCFVGTLFEAALAADRSYMLDDTDDPAASPAVALSSLSERLTMSNHKSRLEQRYLRDSAGLERARAAVGRLVQAKEAFELGIVTVTPDELDWSDEIRVALEERTSLSPDALTGMEANLRFAGPETCETKVYGRLTAWQNWVFSRPNAVGERGALKLYGAGSKPEFDWQRV